MLPSLDASPAEESPEERIRDVYRALPGAISTISSRPPSPWGHVGGNLVDPFLNVPNVALDQTSKELVALNFQSRTLRQHRDDWFTTGLFDPAAFNQVLAIAALHLEELRWNKPLKPTKLALTYNHMAMKSARERLQKLQRRNLLRADNIANQDAETTDEIDRLIGTTSGLTCWSDNISSQEQFLMHRRGTVQLVKARRGGLDALETHLRATISWVELLGALAYDVAPHFPLPNEWMQKYNIERAKSLLYQANVSPAALSIKQAWSKQFPDQANHPWLEIFETFSAFCALENAEARSHPVSLNREHSLLLPIWTNTLVHRLLSLPNQTMLYESISTSESLQAAALAKACRLAMLLFMAPIWRRYDVTPTPTFAVVQKQFDHLLSRWQLLLSLAADPWFAQLTVWILCVTIFEAEDCDSSVSASDNSTLQWLESALREICIGCGIPMRKAQDVEAMLRRALWVDGLLDEKVARLGHRLQQHHPD